MAKTQSIPIFDSVKEAETHIRVAINQTHGCPNGIMDLWDYICAYADFQYSKGNVGNSGEFYDEDEDKEVDRDLFDALSRLQNKFADVLGWMPREHELSPPYVFRMSTSRYKYTIETIWIFDKHD